MIPDALLKEYFNLTNERRDEIMDVVVKQLISAYDLLKETTGEENAKLSVMHTLHKELEKSIDEENYEFSEIINILLTHMKDALD